MDILLNQVTPNLKRLESFMTINAAKELSQLAIPCYYPKTKRFYFELLKILNIKDKDVKEFVKRTYKGTKAEKWVLWKDVGTNLMIFIIHLFFKNNMKKAANITLIYYMIIQYSRLMHKQIKFCYEDTFKYTLDNMIKSHLFNREKTIPGSIYFLSDKIQKRFLIHIEHWDIDQIILFISVARHRISQSIKSFAEKYYKNRENGLGYKTQKEDSEDPEKANMYQFQIQQRGQKIIDDILKKLAIYKTIDRKSFDLSKKQSKIKTSIAILIVDKITDEKHSENIKIALQLFIKNLTNINMICGNQYINCVKSLMGIKRLSHKLQFKSQINILLKGLLKDINLQNQYFKYTSQTQFTINSFIAFYITGMIKTNICK